MNKSALRKCKKGEGGRIKQRETSGQKGLRNNANDLRARKVKQLPQRKRGLGKGTRVSKTALDEKRGHGSFWGK